MAGGGGGAWKVAYADFITAMMALFMVLWILGAEQDLLEQLQEYFRNPPSPFEKQSGKFPVEIGEFSGHSSSNDKEVFFDSKNPTVLQGLVEEFYKVLDVEMSSDEAAPVEIAITSDGLRLLIFDRQDTRLFIDGGSQLTDWGVFLIQSMAWLLTRYPFDVVIESHSGELDASHQSNWTADYGPWELTSDRANEIRRRLQFYANGNLDIKRVSGYGTSKPLENRKENERTNQRVSLALSLDKEAKALRDPATVSSKLAKVDSETEE